MSDFKEPVLVVVSIIGVVAGFIFGFQAGMFATRNNPKHQTVSTGANKTLPRSAAPSSIDHGPGGGGGDIGRGGSDVIKYTPSKAELPPEAIR